MQKITVYSTPTCAYCVMAKNFLTKNNFEYSEYNVADDLKARQEMVDKSHQLGVPVIDIDGEIFVGFDKSAITKALWI